MKNLVEYEYDGLGYNPVLIAKNWQLAFLNDLESCHYNTIDKVERHTQTDEAFVLLAGRAVLVAFSAGEWEMTEMQPTKIYNVPTGVWHAIALEETSKVLICEDANTHLNDVEYYPLNPADLLSFKQNIASFFTEKTCSE